MRSLIAALLLTVFNLWVLPAQNFFTAQWESSGISYEVFILGSDDETPIVTARVQYHNGEILKVVEYDLSLEEGETLEGRTYAGLIGSNPRLVYPKNSNLNVNYSPDSFYFFDDETELDQDIPIPYTADANEEYANGLPVNLRKVDSWKTLEEEDLTDDFLYEFYDRDEKEYLAYVYIPPSTETSKEYESSSSSYTETKSKWHVTMTKYTNLHSQSWKREETFPKSWISDKWDEGKHITSVGYGNGEWAIAMSKGSGYSNQSWKTSSTWPEDWIKTNWNKGKAITSVSYGNGLFALVMSEHADYDHQAYKISSEIPADWISDRIDQRNEAVSSVAHTGSQWVLVTTSGLNKNSHSQVYLDFDYYPEYWISQKQDKDYHIKAMAYGNGTWLVFMHNNTGFGSQTQKHNEIFPNSWISEKWDQDYKITHMTYGKE